MYSFGLNTQSTNKIQTTQRVETTTTATQTRSAQSRVMSNPFNPTSTHGVGLVNVRCELITADEKQKYTDLIRFADSSDRQNLQTLLKNGTLLNNNSDDNSTTLDNLHKIITEERASGLDSKMVLKETLSALANPFVINQQFGDIPKPYVKPIVDNVRPNVEARNAQVNPKSINVQNSSTCVSASIEFALAKQQPAEFARFANGLTSKNISVEKTVDLSSLTDNKKESFDLLNSFKIPYKKQGEDKVRVLLAPDNNAIIRARIQNSHKDEGERSLVDVLMQSTFMNVGSQQTYDTLTDARGGQFSTDSKALVDYEKTFVESVVQNKNKTCVVYQQLDDEGRISGYTTDFKTMMTQIAKTLKSGECVVAGYTFTDPVSKKVIGGHEITIIGITQNKNGDLMFVCNDTDDGKNVPVLHKVTEFLPQINHVGIPTELV